MTKRRVVVTGLGAITPCGNTVESFWQAMLAGQSGVAPITLFNTAEHTSKIAAEVKDFNPEDYMEKKEARRMDRFMQFALAAAKQAYDDADLKSADLDPDRFSVVIGSGSGGISTIENELANVLDKGYRRCSPFFIPSMISDLAAGRVSIEFNAQGPNMAVVTACASGSDSIGSAFRMIQYGEVDVAITGGAEAGVSPLSMAGFGACRALSTRNDDPQGASRPFDKDRDGFVMGEGSCLLVLEEYEHAVKRGAKIYGEVLGYGRSSDAFDIVQPSPGGRGAAKAMQMALKDAGVQPQEVGYVNAHATSTPAGDNAEVAAMIAIFGEHATGKKLLVSGTKSMTGHMLGSAGSTEALISLLALRDKKVPPTINVEEVDPECAGIDVVPNHAREKADLKVAMSNSFGFGGHNATLIFGAWGNN